MGAWGTQSSSPGASAFALGRGVRAAPPSQLGVQGMSLGLMGSLCHLRRAPTWSRQLFLKEVTSRQPKSCWAVNSLSCPSPVPAHSAEPETVSPGADKEGPQSGGLGPLAGSFLAPLLRKAWIGFQAPPPWGPRSPLQSLYPFSGKLHFPLFFHKTP